MTFCVLFGLLAAASAPFSASAATKPVLTKKPVVPKPYHIAMSVSSIPGADEHQIENPVSRCLTATMKAMNQKALAVMKTDVEKSGTGHPTAVATYKAKLDMVWSAMEQPYCGFGSLGLTAVKKSFLKSTDRIREAYLEAVKEPVELASK